MSRHEWACCCGYCTGEFGRSRRSDEWGGGDTNADHDAVILADERRDAMKSLNLTRLESAGYEWDTDTKAWVKVVRVRQHTARRAHHGIARGERYTETTTRMVDDDTGKSRSERTVCWALPR